MYFCVLSKLSLPEWQFYHGVSGSYICCEYMESGSLSFSLFIPRIVHHLKGLDFKLDIQWDPGLCRGELSFVEQGY